MDACDSWYNNEVPDLQSKKKCFRHSSVICLLSLVIFRHSAWWSRRQARLHLHFCNELYSVKCVNKRLQWHLSLLCNELVCGAWKWIKWCFSCAIVCELMRFCNCAFPGEIVPKKRNHISSTKSPCWKTIVELKHWIISLVYDSLEATQIRPVCWADVP